MEQVVGILGRVRIKRKWLERNEEKKSLPAQLGRNMRNKEVCQTSWFFTKCLVVGLKKIKLIMLRVHAFTAQPKCMVPKCIEGEPELLDLKRPYERKDDGYTADAQWGEKAYRMPLNYIRYCALSMVRLGAETYWNRFLWIIMFACMPEFLVCYLHQL